MTWLEGKPLLSYADRPLEERNRIATALFRAWWHPFAHYGVIHGDPHLGNYSVFDEDGAPAGVNLLDYGCIRIFPPSFRGGRDRALSRLPARRPRDVSPRPTDLGLPRPQRRVDRYAECLGALHLCAAARRPRAHHRRRHRAAQIRPARGVAGEAGAAAERPGHDSARVRADEPRRGRARRGVPAPQGGDRTSTGCSRRRSRLLEREALEERQSGALAAAGLQEAPGREARIADDDTAGQQPGSWRSCFSGGNLARLFIVCFGVWLHAADSLFVATMMPDIVADIGGARLVAWTVALYEVGSIAAGASRRRPGHALRTEAGDERRGADLHGRLRGQRARAGDVGHARRPAGAGTRRRRAGGALLHRGVAALPALR